MVPSPYLVAPGKKFKLSDCPTDDTGPFKDKHDARRPTADNLKKLDQLQEVLYAQAKHALLIVFQAMDGGGKDGAISHVFRGVNPQGCSVASFKVPTPLESAHDFLWRIHAATPSRGMIGIFNRSHYESVLVERVKDLTPEKVWSKRYTTSITSRKCWLMRERRSLSSFCTFLGTSKKPAWKSDWPIRPKTGSSARRI